MQKPSQDSPLAYEDSEFLASDDARPLRIIAEYLSPMRRLRRQRVHDTIVSSAPRGWRKMVLWAASIRKPANWRV